MSETQDAALSGSSSITVDSASAVRTEVSSDPQVYRLSLQVNVVKSGPCKRHVTVVVPRKDIDHYREEAMQDLRKNAQVPGFRVGHVPRNLIEKRFKKDVTDHVKQKILVDSLEQVATDHELDAINEPDLAVLDLVIPETGDFEYDFNVEVRPDFDLPEYSGLKLVRPTREITEADTDAQLQELLASFSQHENVDRPAVAGDRVICDISISHNDKLLGRFGGRQIDLKPTLAFADAELEKLDELLAGVVPGDQRQGEATVSNEASNLDMRGEKVQVTFDVKSVQETKALEMNDELLEILGVESLDSLRESVKKSLERQLKHTQRQSARSQILTQIIGSSEWDLPESLVRRQVENAMRRELLEMQQAGYTPDQVKARSSELRQKAISTTRQALKEHFVLDRIASKEKLEVNQEDVEIEIQLMAAQQGVTVRRMRTHLEKNGMIENLVAQILERKAIDLVIEQAQFEDRPAEEKVERKSSDVCGIEIEICQPTSIEPVREEG